MGHSFDQTLMQKYLCLQCSKVVCRDRVLVVSNATKTEITIFNYFFDYLKFVLVVTSISKLLKCANILFFQVLNNNILLIRMFFDVDLPYHCR